MNIIKGINTHGIQIDKKCSCGLHFSYLGPDKFIDTVEGNWFDCSCGSTHLIPKKKAVEVKCGALDDREEVRLIESN